jgi:FKBP-type peptidyl-prolyl cis-trans isomerase FklB
MRCQALLALSLSLVLSAAAFAQNDKNAASEAVAPPPAEEIDVAKIKPDYSYTIGLNVGRSIKADGIDVDIDELIKGLTDGVKAAKPKLTEEQMRQCMIALQGVVQAKAEQEAKAIGDKNKKDGEAFLAANKSKPGVKTTASGLQYKVLKEGKAGAPKPKKTDKVRTHYHGTLISGKVFDSSVERGEPISFPVNGVIPGWTEALQLMKVGDKWQLFIPSELAYGERGAGEDIGPNSTLIFEVELLGIGE